VVAKFVVAKMESFVVAKLLTKIHTHTARVAIIGLGYVGLAPLVSSPTCGADGCVQGRSALDVAFADMPQALNLARAI